jgi:hypothetical protein
LWARANPLPHDITRAKSEKQASRTTARGIEISKADGATHLGHAVEHPSLVWLARVAVPFSYSASKNAIYSLRAKGHVYLRKESKAWRNELRDRLTSTIQGQRVANNKVWLDIIVEKTNHKGDAVNVIDTVCDAVKEALGLDDRWYSIRHLDWRISKDKPQIIVGVGQESNEDVQACSSCGRLLPFGSFGKKSNARHGIDRNCKDCRSEKRRS